MFFDGSNPGLGFSEAVREHQAMVYSIGLHFFRNSALAEELAQDVFLRLHQCWASLESPAHVVHWLRKTMTQRCIDHSRRARLRRCIGLEQAREPAIPARETDPFLSARLDELVGQLPERARAIVILRYQEDLEPAEIAEMLQLSMGSVKSTLHRSLVWLRERMERMRVGHERLRI
jgi:RNA polymerase sigma-70 factor (ECF subfamily)